MNNDLVYFMGTKDTPLEKHLYCVSFSNPGVVQRLTVTGYSHNVTLSKVRFVKSRVLLFF